MGRTNKKQANSTKVTDEVVVNSNNDEGVANMQESTITTIDNEVNNNELKNGAEGTEENAASVAIITDNDDSPAAVIAKILQMELSPTEQWSRILKAAEARLDESKITDVNMLSEAEIQRRLKLIASKMTRARKMSDVNGLAALQEEANELKAARVKRGTSRVRTAGVPSDIDPTKLSYEDLNKLIRNVQSKKSTAKKAGELLRVNELEAEEQYLRGLREQAQPAPKVDELSKKIQSTIDELLKLEQTPAVVSQIEMLKTLL